MDSKKFFWMGVFVLTLFFSSSLYALPPEGVGLSKYFVTDSGGSLANRDEIDPKYTWDLSELYKSDELWEVDFQWLETKLGEYSQFEGKLGTCAREMLSALEFDEQVSVQYFQVRNYASLSSDLDTRNQKYQAMLQRATNLGSKLSTASAFFKPEILSIPEDTLKSFLAEEPKLVQYEQFFGNILRAKPHTLSKEQEALLAQASPALEASADTFGLLANADLKYPVVKDSSGNDFQISPGKYYAALYSTDRSFRERVYKGFYEPYKALKNTFASLFNGNMKSLIFNKKARKYDSTLKASLTPNNIPVSIYENLIDSVNANLAPLQRWARLKQKVLGLSDFHPYDTYVTLFPSVEKQFTYDQGRDLVIEALKPFGQKYIDSLTTAFDNRWIDVFETPGKRSGAYSTGPIFGFHPFVLLNWNNTQNDVFTLAHEMGHNMHSYFSQNKQPFVYADYSIFVAEVASTANEALLLEYLIEKAQSPEEKMALIEENLNNIDTTFYRQTRFAEYERLVHQLTEQGESLTPDRLTELFAGLFQKYWGESMTVDVEEGYSWARIPHFYYNFYVYQYATSFAASQALVEKIKKEGQPAIDRFLEFLASGSSKYPIDVLKDAGVDMSSPQTVLAVINKMNSLLDQLEQLLEKK